nr:diguanylate cyclase [Marinobacter gelidimuriae]
MSAELSWKDQYLRELDAAEHREQQWQQHRMLLERMLGRMKGQSEALATQLETMQQKIVTMETESELMREQVLKERWQRYKGEMTIAIVDIDLFKRINDSYGHKAGDRVLQLLARELKKDCVRQILSPVLAVRNLWCCYRKPQVSRPNK